MTSLWCEHAWLGGEVVDTGVVVKMAGGRITSVQSGLPPPPGAVRLRGLTLPGLVNSHSHAFHRALRGRTERAGDFWSWRELMYGVAERLDPDRLRALTTAVFAEMALAGITTVGEFHYLHHDRGGRRYTDPNATGRALIEAAAAASVRLTLLDACYLRGGIDQDLVGVQERFGDGSADGWAELVEALTMASDTARLGAAIHSVRAVPPEEMAVVADWAAGRQAVLHAHVSEQPAENEACLARYGQTPTGLLAGAGAVGKTFTAVHATHLTAADVGLLGSALVCFCPTTERDLADGIGPSPDLVRAGARLCLGSDSHAAIDLFEEARAVELNQRLVTHRRAHHAPTELLRAATLHGAESLGWEAGWIEPGRLADLVTVSLDGPHLAGIPPADLASGVVFAATSADVTDVFLGGRPVVTGGVHLRVQDVGEALATAIGAVS